MVFIGLFIAGIFFPVNALDYPRRNMNVLGDGKLMPPMGKSLPLEDPVIAAYDIQYLYVDYLAFSPGITMTITAEDGTVLYNDTKAGAPTSFSVYIGDYAPGTYLVEFRSATGYAYGEKVIEEVE